MLETDLSLICILALLLIDQPTLGLELCCIDRPAFGHTELVAMLLITDFLSSGVLVLALDLQDVVAFLAELVVGFGDVKGFFGVFAFVIWFAIAVWTCQSNKVWIKN